MDQYALIGNPVGHSLSPRVHVAFAQQTQQDISYTTIQAAPDDFCSTVQAFQEAGGRGMNVTLPFKQAAYQLATIRSPAAQQAGSSNTLSFRSNHEIYAGSTDGPGLIQDIVSNHHYGSLQNKRLLIIGAGGVVPCLVGSLLAEQPTQLVIANRTPEKAASIAQRFNRQGPVESAGLTDIPHHAPYDLIINATSASLSDALPALSAALITAQHTWCYDLCYSPSPTRFLQWSRQHAAARCLDGLGMLVEQAALSFFLWRGIRPETGPVITMLRDAIAAQQSS